MSPDGAQKPVNQNGGEPSAGFSEIHLWLIMVFGGLFYWSQLYLDGHAGGFSPRCRLCAGWFHRFHCWLALTGRCLLARCIFNSTCCGYTGNGVAWRPVCNPKLLVTRPIIEPRRIDSLFSRFLISPLRVHWQNLAFFCRNMTKRLRREKGLQRAGVCAKSSANSAPKPNL